MARPISDFKKVIRLLEELHKDYPGFNLGRHLSTALDDYGDFWGITDKELYFILDKYRTELELDHNHIVDEDYVNKIIKDSQNFDDLLKETDGYEEEE